MWGVRLIDGGRLNKVGISASVGVELEKLGKF